MTGKRKLSNFMHHNWRQAGFSMMETALSLVATGALSVLFVGFLEEWARVEKVRASVEYIRMIEDGLQEWTSDIQRFDAIYERVEASGGFMEIPIRDDTGVNAYDTSMIFGDNVSSPFLPLSGAVVLTDDFRGVSPLGQNMTLVVRIVDDLATDTDTREMEFLIASLNRVPDTLVRALSESAGAQAGYISVTEEGGMPCQVSGVSVACDSVIRGGFGDWSLDLAAYPAMRWTNTIAAAPPTTAGGSYFVLFKYTSARNIDDKEGYLYRVAVPGRPDLNAMHAHLDLGSNDVVGADNVTVNDRLGVNKMLLAEGAVHVGGALAVRGGSMVVDDDLQAEELIVAHDLDPSVSAPDSGLEVDGHFSVRNIEVTDTLAFDVGHFGEVDVPYLEVGPAATANVRYLDSYDRTTEVGGTLVTDPSQKIEVESLLTADKVEVTDVDVQKYKNYGVPVQVSAAFHDVESLDPNSEIHVGDTIHGTADDTITFYDVKIKNLRKCYVGCN